MGGSLREGAARLCAVPLRSRRRGGLRKARLRSPSFSPSFLHTHKVTTVLLSFSYGEWNFGLLCASFVVGEGAGRGGVVILSCFYLRGHFRLHGRCWRSLTRAWSVQSAFVVRLDGWRGSGRGAARTWKGAAQPEKRRNTTSATGEGTGQPLYFTRIAAAPRGRERTRAPGYSAPRSGRLQGVERRARPTTRHQHIR